MKNDKTTTRLYSSLFSSRIFHYGLLGFNILSVVAIIYIGHTHLRQYSDMLAQMQDKHESIQRANRLLELVRTADQPGNEVFESRDVKSEKIRLDAARDELKVAFRDEKLFSTNQLPGVQEKIEKMLHYSESTLEHFAKNDLIQASALMSKMDQTYGEVASEVERKRNELATSQGALLSEYYQQIKRIALQGGIFSAAVLSAVIALTLYTSRSLKGREQLEKKNQQLLEELEDAQRVAKLGSWSFDLQTGRIFWSKQMFELFDEPTENAPTYEKHLSTIHPEDQTLWIKTVETALQTGESYQMRFRSIFPGKTIWVEALGRGRRDAQGKIVGLFGTCRDITEEKALEAKLANERAKTAQTAKLASLGEMAAGVAHEINNPLAIILGNLTLLPKYRDQREKHSEKIETIRKSVERISKIVKGLKKFSRSNIASPRKLLSLREIILESIALIEHKAKKALVQIETDIDQTNDYKIECDDVEIEQVLINLLGNAIDAVKNQNSPWIKVLLCSDGNDALIQVFDSGRGIPKNIEDKMFTPFFTTKPVGEGTGLGLSISRGIIEDHLGSLRVNHDYSNTCFEIRLPKWIESETRKVA